MAFPGSTFAPARGLVPTGTCSDCPVGAVPAQDTCRGDCDIRGPTSTQLLEIVPSEAPRSSSQLPGLDWGAAGHFLASLSLMVLAVPLHLHHPEARISQSANYHRCRKVQRDRGGDRNCSRSLTHRAPDGIRHWMIPGVRIQEQIQGQGQGQQDTGNLQGRQSLLPSPYHLPDLGAGCVA